MSVERLGGVPEYPAGESHEVKPGDTRQSGARALDVIPDALATDGAPFGESQLVAYQPLNLHDLLGDEPSPLYVKLQHRECPTEEAPVLEEPCGGPDESEAPSRVPDSSEAFFPPMELAEAKPAPATDEPTDSSTGLPGGDEKEASPDQRLEPKHHRG